jgi:tRNA nucleotidyltransferase/poly(A) polymerase
MRAVRFASTYNFKISNEIQNQIIAVHQMQPIFDEKVSKPRIGRELMTMFSDRKVGLHSIELMTDLGILDNYVAEICNPHKSEVSEACFMKDTFK